MDNTVMSFPFNIFVYMTSSLDLCPWTAAPKSFRDLFFWILQQLHKWLLIWLGWKRKFFSSSYLLLNEDHVEYLSVFTCLLKGIWIYFTEQKIIMGHWNFPKNQPKTIGNTKRRTWHHDVQHQPLHTTQGCFLVPNSKTIPFHVGYIYLHVVR